MSVTNELENYLNEDQQGPSDSISEKDAEKSPTFASASKPITSSDIPDGEIEAWMLVAGAWCTSFCSFGWVNSLFPYASSTSAAIVSPRVSDGQHKASTVSSSKSGGVEY